jgi:hypothetical protein
MIACSKVAASCRRLDRTGLIPRCRLIGSLACLTGSFVELLGLLLELLGLLVGHRRLILQVVIHNRLHSRGRRC